MPERPGVLTSAPPGFTTPAVEALALEIFGLSGTASALGSERDQNFRLDAGPRGTFLLKLSNAAEGEAGAQYETGALLHIARTDPELPVMRPRPTSSGIYWDHVPGEGEDSHLIRLFSFLEGRHASSADLDLRAISDFGATLARLGRALRGFFHPAAGRDLLWDERRAPELRALTEHVTDTAIHALVSRTLDRFDERVAPVIDSLRAQTIHNDFSLDNTLLGDDDRVSGILDFGDLTHTTLVCDISTAMSSVMFGRDDPLAAGVAVVDGYAAVTPLENAELEVLPDLLAARLVALITVASWRVGLFPDNTDYIMGSVDEAVTLLSWLDAGGYEDLARRLGPPTRAGSGASLDDLLARRRILGSAMSPLSYTRPLHLVRGEGPWLFDGDGSRYLDAYNNVPVVGHGHPHVTEAIARQSRALNTNLRYLHENSLELAERLCATLPAGLEVCMFVNSGSEANDLAWQLARAATGNAGGIVTAYAYHGVTAAAADLSPEHWATGYEPRAVTTIPAPDGYAGIYRRDDPTWAERYAAELDGALATLAERHLEPAALFLDSGFTSDGILSPPPEYGRDLVRRIRAAGGLFVADEVQTGFGRMGTHMWGFEALGEVVPDIVTLGKPMGNGHPVAAVIATHEIVDRFAETVDFFSTFGGNPVACAAGLAVLDVIEGDGIPARVALTGADLLGRALELQGRHPAIGEVRGHGLLVGVALATDDVTRAPDAALAQRVIDVMRERGVLIGTTGREGNVLKIRPPLVIDSDHVDLLVTTLDEALREG